MHPRISVSQASSRTWTVEEDLAFYADHDIDRIGVSLPKLAGDGEDPAPAIEQITSSGVQVTSVLAHNPFTLADRSGWDGQAEQLSATIDATEALGCDTIVVPFGCGGALAWERSADALEEALVPTLRQAQRQGIWFLLEPTNSLRSDVSFVHTLRDALDLSWRLDTGVCMELTASWNERNLVGTVHSGVAGIGLVHVADYALGTHDTPNRMVPGDGDIPLERILGQLLETGYEGLFEVELLGPVIDAEGYAGAIGRSVEWLDVVLTTLGAGPPHPVRAGAELTPVDFSSSPDAEAFRAEVRQWLAEHVTDELRGLPLDLAGGDPWLDAMRQWNRTLADAGYAAIDWPVAWGGRGASLTDQVVLAEELARADAPGTLNPIGIANIAPAIMQFGTDEQRRRLLPPMARGDEIWCQGFSEPDAGSDLASLTTSAIRDGDHFVVNGQKVWNTLGHLADWCELLVRTDPAQPRHRGISCLLVDMRLPGITVRPLVTITGDREFSELFFNDVRVPVDALLGPENDGWTVAMSTLSNERAGVAALHLLVRKKIARLMDLARTTTRPGGGRVADEPALRRRLAAAYLRGEYLKLIADRTISGHLHGRPHGPESSVAKLVWSELEQELGQLAGEILGPAANAGEWGRDRVSTRSLTIAGGTTQVNKNVIAQRVLGLPRA